MCNNCKNCNTPSEKPVTPSEWCKRDIEEVPFWGTEEYWKSVDLVTGLPTSDGTGSIVSFGIFFVFGLGILIGYCIWG